MITPLAFFILDLILVCAVLLKYTLRSRRRSRELRELATSWGMHYSPSDQLRLANRIAGKLPMPGAANVRVRDVMFYMDDQLHRYLFTTEYSVGIIRGKSGRAAVTGFAEPIARGASAGPAQLVIAPYDLPLPQAYELVRDALAQPAAHE